MASKRKAKGNPQSIVKLFVLISDLLGEWSANDEPDMSHVSQLTEELIDHAETLQTDEPGFMEFVSGNGKKLHIGLTISVTNDEAD